MVSRGSLARGRKRANQLMRCTVSVSRPTGRTVTDPETFKDTQEVTPVWSGRGKVQSYEAHEQNSDVAGSQVTVVRTRVDVPVGAFTARPDDVVRVVASPDDPLLEGRVYRVAGVAPYKSMATAYRIFVDEVTRS